MNVTPPQFVSWDWKEQPDVDDLDRAVRRATDGAVRVIEVETGSDLYAIYVGPHESQEEVQRLFEEASA